MHLEINKLTFSFREEFMVSENLIGEKFMIPCKNIHPCDSANKSLVELRRIDAISADGMQKL